MHDAIRFLQSSLICKKNYYKHEEFHLEQNKESYI